MVRFMRQLRYQLFLLTVLLVYTVFSIYPLLKSVVLSFTDFDGYVRTYDFVGLKNYSRIFVDDAILSGLTFTLIFAFASTLLITV